MTASDLGSLADSLTDALLASIDDTVGEHEAWRIDSDHKATWALRKYAEAQRAIDRAEALASEQRAVVDQWLESANAPHHRTLSFMETRLVEYLRSQQDDKGEPRRLNLPGGVVQARRSTSIQVLDEERLRTWLAGPGKAHADDWLERRVTVRVGDIKKALEPDADGVLIQDDRTGLPMTAWPSKDGELVPAVRLERRDNYSIDPAPLPQG